MKAFKKITLLAVATLLSACSKPTLLPNPTTIPDESTITTEPEEDIPTHRYSSVWGDEYGELIIGSLGVDLPYINNQGFDIELSEDNYGDPLVCIYVYEYEGHDSISLMEEYAVICDNANYAVTSGTQSYFDENYNVISFNCYYADGWINDVDAVEIQFMEGKHNGKYALGIFAFNYIHYDNHKWPSNIINKLLGHDVPQYYEEGLKYEAYLMNDDGIYAYIDVTNANEYSEEEYKQILEDAGYYIDDSGYDEYGYLAYPINYQWQDHGIQFSYSYAYGLEILIVPLDF